MLFSVDDVRGYDIVARNGSLGDVHDLFFDDHYWTVRYLVVDTGRWLPGRKVLISPEAVASIDSAGHTVAVTLSKEEVKEGPGIATDLPVSRQREVELSRHFNWSRYWEVYPAGVGAAPLIPPMPMTAADTSPDGKAADDRPTDDRQTGDPNLRSAREVDGYRIGAEDGEIGHVSDFLVDSDSWQIRYLVIDTRNWLPGRKVVIAPQWAEGISWSGGVVRVRLTRDQIKNSPEFMGVDEVDRTYETRLYGHYGGTPYWE